ncbi:hypothetical protein HHK36_020246 [Tetracentron sinense]|uniref:Uncharacterized protein n=1 Tax=Tetracentron sinense TaxID=13715 RepID=A0A834YRA1_TETSI|nr:hypothetical protein HHK36_020246 [Tetracentron sinense]
MAESVISFLVNRLGDLLIQEIIFLHGVHEQLEELQTDMRGMQSFLKAADASAYQGNEQVRNLVNEIKGIAYDSEDVVDTFIFQVASRGRYGVLKRYASIFNEWIDLYKTGRKIQAIQKRIHAITNRWKTFNIKNIDEGEGTSSANQKQQQLRRTYPHAEEEDAISLEKDMEALVAQLITAEERRRVISIVGMGGLGKTTLATKLYNHNPVKLHFDCRAWVFISQQCQKKDVLQAILKRVSAPTTEEMERMNEDDLVEKLYHVLQEKRYLVVLDDIWSMDTWNLLKIAFPKGKVGSKIMITTRNIQVALHADPFSLPHEPRRLTDEESWVLLCKKAFPKDVVARGDFPDAEMERLGREMVKKCGGLPLAVVVLGGLLATKKSPYEWEMLYINFNILLSEGQLQQRVMGILALSYHDLPYYLKPCFLYLGLFPEDFEISTSQLIRLWVAEGFVILQEEGEGERTMEDLAEKCLEELIFRCMVQVGRRDSNERVKTFRIHDLMRDLCIKEAKVDSFLEILHKGGHMEVADSFSISVAKARRCAIHFGDNMNVPWEQKSSHLRSILFFQTAAKKINIGLGIMQMISICKKFKLLRVLDLRGGLQLTSLDREIGSLIHLRFLGFRDSFELELPPSLGNLRGLQTLDFKLHDSHLHLGISPRYKVPNVICKMKQLRHLYLNPYLDSGHLRLDTLSNLQTLSNIWAGGWIEKDLSKLTNIRKLEIWFTQRRQVEIVLESLILRLKSLSFIFSDELSSDKTFPDLKPIFRCNLLSKLHLRGRIENLVPENNPFPLNLTKLHLNDSQLEQDQMAILENLPRLKILLLGSNSFIGKEMVCSTRGFPQLKLLTLSFLRELEEWRVEEGAMPSLRHLEIHYCEKLRMVPEGLKFVTTLLELKIKRMPENFKDRLQVLDGRGGRDLYTVQHIPSITFLDQEEEE